MKYFKQISVGFYLHFVFFNVKLQIFYFAYCSTMGGQDVIYTGMGGRSNFLAYVVGRVIYVSKTYFPSISAE